MTIWAILALAAGTFGFRLAGPLLRGRIKMSERSKQWMSWSAVALLAALVATAALTADGGFAGWSRPAGVAVGALAAWRKLPFVVVVIAAAATTALLRLAGLP